MVDKAIKVIFVDDDEMFVKTFKREAQKKGIIIKHFFNAEEAEEEIKSGNEKMYGGIVLDVKGLANRQSQIPDHAYFSQALFEFKKITTELKIYGITGETDSRSDWAKTFENVTTIYSKELKDINSLLDAIKKDAMSLPHIKLMNKYKSVFEKSEKILTKNEQLILFAATENMDSSGANIPKTLSSLRTILEAIFREINKIRPDVVATSNITGEIKVRKILTELNEKNFLNQRNDYIYKLFDTVYTCMSNHGSHVSQAENYGTCHKPAGINTVRMCTFAVMDLIEWSHEVIYRND